MYEITIIDGILIFLVGFGFIQQAIKNSDQVSRKSFESLVSRVYEVENTVKVRECQLKSDSMSVDYLLAAHRGETVMANNSNEITQQRLNASLYGFAYDASEDINFTCPLCKAEVKTVKHGEKHESETYECSCGLNLHIKSNIL